MKRRANTRIGNGLVALGSAAVLTVYSAGFLRTRAAAQRLAGAEQRRVAPAPAEAGGSPTPAFIEPPARTDVGQSASSTTTNTARAVTPPASKRTAKATATTAAPAPEAPTAPAGSTEIVAPPSAPPVPASPMPAPAPVVVPPATGSDGRVEPAPPPRPSLYKDGTYSGWGTSRHGDIQASVVIEDGRIVTASITQCLTRYSCSWIAHLPPQVVNRQSPEVDYVSGATQSTNAFYYAIVEALSKAK